MCRSTATRTVTVANPEGLHARAATLIAEVVRRHHAEVKITKGLDRVDAVDVLQVLSLGTHEGEQLMLEASGQDSDAVLQELERLFVNQFQVEKQRTENQ
jgi:phosphotransferase system HPr (HPr) family protein